MRALVLILSFFLSALSIQAQSWQKCTLPAGFNPSGTSSTYLDVFFLPSNPQYGWVCGFNGYVLRTTNQGLTWQGTVVPYNGRAGGHLESVHFVTPLIGYCSGVCGIFKSTDGGASWTDLTSLLPPSSNVWGLYFLNDQWGCAVGGGCNSSQNFYLTTNGGTSWSVFSLSIPTSGMTDLILKPDGSGLAVGSGQLYKTLDSGRTWSTYQPAFPAIWDEELTQSGSSIVVPFAGQDCAGGSGAAGGARFSTDNGANWTSFAVNSAFYGAYLLNPTTAWACGNNRNMWRTTNSGQNWELKSCGIDGDVDDCWFIDDTTGFVVGNAVYRYAAAERSLSKTTIDFGTMCFPGVKYDTIYVRNRSFSGAGASWLVTGSDAQHFSILQPVSANFGIGSCDSAMFVIRFQPRTAGLKNIALTVNFVDGTVLTAAISGSSGGNLTAPVDTLINVASLQCGTPIRVTVNFNNGSTQTDQVIAVNRLSGTAFKLEGTTPFIIPPGGGAIGFNVTLADTGWQTSRFQIRVGPCLHDTTVTLKAYGVSPIIDVPLQRNYSSQCLGVVYDTIPVSNTGNADLVITSNSIASGGSEFTIAGWVGGESIPVTIPRGTKKFIIICFKPVGSGISAAVLRLTNNDMTTARGVKSPVDIQLSGSSSGINNSLSTKLIDFGQICPGQVLTKTLRLLNSGTSAFSVEQKNVIGPAYQLSCSRALPTSLNPGDSVVWTVQFPNTVVGVYLDSIVLGYKPCDSARVVIPIRAEIVSTSLRIVNPSLDTVLGIGTKATVPFTLTNTGTSDATIETLSLSPADARWTLASAPALPFVLKAGQSIIVQVEVLTDSKAELSGNLVATATKLCSASVVVPLHISVVIPEMLFSRNSFLFPIQHCMTSRVSDSLVTVSASKVVQQLVDATILPAGSVFSLNNSPVPPQTINPGDSLVFHISGVQVKQGVDSATLYLRFKSSVGEQEVYLPLRMENTRPVLSSTTTSLDFGTHEPCDAKQRLNIHLENSGLLDDDVVISMQKADPALSLASSAHIGVGSFKDIEVVFDPSVLPERSIEDSVIIVSTVCDTRIAIPLRAVLNDPHLIVGPKQLDYGVMWKGDVQTRWFSIVNHSSAKRRVTSITSLSNASQTIRIKPPTAPPFDVSIGDSIAIPVEIQADSSGNWSADIRVIDQSSCIDTNTIRWNVQIPLEVYRAHLSIQRNVLVHVGAEAELAVVLRTDDTSREALFRAQPKALSFDLEYDGECMDVLRVYSYNAGLRQDVPLARVNGRTHLRLPAEQLRNIGASDTIAFIHSRGMQHMPNHTLVHPLNVKAEVEPSKPVVITTDDGDFAVQGCLMWVRFTSIDPFSIQIATHPADQQIGLRVGSSAGSHLRWTLHSVAGQLVSQDEAELSSCPADLVIPTTELASGTYLLRIQNDAFQEQFMMVVVQH